jgi:multidrug resistance efflux pump
VSSRARANLDIAKQQLEDATVRAPSEGTIIDKTVSKEPSSRRRLAR